MLSWGGTYDTVRHPDAIFSIVGHAWAYWQCVLCTDTVYPFSPSRYTSSVESARIPRVCVQWVANWIGRGIANWLIPPSCSYQMTNSTAEGNAMVWYVHRYQDWAGSRAELLDLYYSPWRHKYRNCLLDPILQQCIIESGRRWSDVDRSLSGSYWGAISFVRSGASRICRIAARRTG